MSTEQVQTPPTTQIPSMSTHIDCSAFKRKPTQDVVEMFVKFDELGSETPGFAFELDEPSESGSYITCSYRHDRTTCELTYGCAVYKRSPKSHFNRKSHNALALSRRKTYPIKITIVDKGDSLNEFHQELRAMIGTKFSGEPQESVQARIKLIAQAKAKAKAPKVDINALATERINAIIETGSRIGDKVKDRERVLMLAKSGLTAVLEQDDDVSERVAKRLNAILMTKIKINDKPVLDAQAQADAHELARAKAQAKTCARNQAKVQARAQAKEKFKTRMLSILVADARTMAKAAIESEIEARVDSRIATMTKTVTDVNNMKLDNDTLKIIVDSMKKIASQQQTQAV